MKRLSAVVAACAFAVSAAAQDLKPGLWEISSKLTSPSGELEKAATEMQAQMADMPPEQRKLMEDMMAKQGVKMGAGAPGDMTVKTCMTPEQVARNEFPAQQGKCKTTSQPRAGNVLKMSFTCTDPPSSGDAVYTFVSPEAFSSKVVVRTTAQGKAETMNMNAKGKWLGADCGPE
ncbi:MAG: DUF3617 domain-containing protein [Myxococcota bacterium]